MKVLTKEQIMLRTKRISWTSTENLCIRYGKQYNTNPSVLLSVFIIETFYRPFWMRAIEYFAVFFGCLQCLLLKLPMKNYTIGKCQLGLATILNFFGHSYYQHSRKILISSVTEMKQIFSVISNRRAIEILAYRLQPITHKASCIYPEKQKSRIRYIGEQFNGRYSYGMLLSEVFYQLA